MKIKNSLLAAAALIAGGLVIAPQLVGAYRGDPSVQGPNYSPERHEAMTQSFADQDFQAWKEQMQGKGRVLEVVTAENFSRFAEAHRLATEGKIEEARQIRQELGLGLNDGNGGRDGAGRGQGRRLGNCSNLE